MQSFLFSTQAPYPGLIEDSLAMPELRFVVGTDEVGRGALAGPVVAAALAIPIGFSLPGLVDSKSISSSRRKLTSMAIKEAGLCWALASVSAAQIDQTDILKASLQAMRDACWQVIHSLSARHGTIAPGELLFLVDGNQRVDGIKPYPQRTIIKGDSLSRAIAGASILAKVARDTLMEELAEIHPHYGFEKHKGYGTAYHLEALSRQGPCPLHRMSFSPCLIWAKKKNRE